VSILTVLVVDEALSVAYRTPSTYAFLVVPSLVITTLYHLFACATGQIVGLHHPVFLKFIGCTL
jgi:hypothetical protein